MRKQSQQAFRSRVLCFAVFGLMLAGCQFLQPSASVPVPDYWPTEGWRSTTPEAQGMDSAKLADLLLAVGDSEVDIHSLLIIRDGYVVVDAAFYPYDGRTVHNVASVTKSLMTTLIGIAIDQSALNLDDPMVSFFPDRAIANLDPRKQAITVRHLASMSSGLECAADPDEPTLREMVASPDYVQFVLDRRVAWEPGAQFIYCSPAIHLLSPVLQQATGMTALDFASTNLFEPLGFGEVVWPSDPQGYTDGWAEVSLDPHDMAKLGFLFLHGGQWDGRQIVSRQWVEQATTPQVTTPDGEDPYGFGWWVETVVEGASARGRGGQNVYVLPAWNMILVTTGGGFQMERLPNRRPAISPISKKLPANPKARHGCGGDRRCGPTSEPTPAATLPAMARISGKTYVFEPNPARLTSIAFEFDGRSEATATVEMGGRPVASAAVGLDGAYRFFKGPDGRPEAFRGAWTDQQTFLLEYDGITNNDHAFLTFHFVGDRVDVTIQETAHEGSLGITGRLQP
jgi:CubicO group peptidase (beta-lactamase class C family)